MPVTALPAKMSRVTPGKEDDQRIARGRALDEGLEAHRNEGLSANKLLAFAGLSSPVWTAAKEGRASVESYEALEAALEHWKHSPGDLNAALAQRKAAVQRAAATGAAPLPMRGTEDTSVVIHGLHVSDRTVDEIRVPAEFIGQPGEIARIVSEVVKGLAAGRGREDDDA